MITRAPLNVEPGLDNPKARPLAAIVSLALFVLLAYTSLQAFGSDQLTDVGTPTDTVTIAEIWFLKKLSVKIEWAFAPSG